MKKIINDADQIVAEMLEGFTSAYDKYYEKHPEVNGVLLKEKRTNQVALVIGGGSGHEPMFSGFVGKGLADAAACGNIFASPDPNTIYQTGKTADSGKGVLFVYGCYAGDNLNFDMGEEFLNEDGIKTAHVRVWDDVASAPPERIEDRRGIAGDVFVIKVAGGACDAGLTLKEALRVTEKARDHTRTIGVATAPGQIPGLEKPTFELGENEIEYGMGLHGEPGIQRTTMQQADVLTEELYRNIKADAELIRGDEVCVLVNGLGSTTIIELSIVYRKLKKLLEADGLSVYDADINSFCTCQEMGGFSITLMKMDEELKQYYDQPCYSPYYAKEAKQKKEDKEPASKELDAAAAKAMLLHIADKLIENKAYLTEIDSAIGDGDHGIGMSGGMLKVKEQLINNEYTSAYEVFEAAGKAMLLSMGGASGVIFGSLYLEGAKGMEKKEALTAQDVAEMLRKSLEAIKERGKAKPGDKTMVDALEPAVLAMEADWDKGLLEMVKSAEAAARKGVEDTKGYVARFGRAKSLMERAVGHQDAGATSVWLIIQGMEEYLSVSK